MSKKVQKTLTGAMAAMMATGVVATPAMAATNNTDVDALYKAAYKATKTAVTEKTQASINEARKAIDALPKSLHWAIGEFSKQVDQVQDPILRTIIRAIKTAEANPTQANINAAKKSIPSDLVQSWKNSYSSAIDKIQQGLQTKALEAIKKAKDSRKEEDIKIAKDLVADILTSDDAAMVAWAKLLQEKVDAIKVYDLDVTKVDSITLTGVKVSFKALSEALRDVTIEVIDNEGNKISVDSKKVLIEGETSQTFMFSTALRNRPEGIWRVNGVEINLDEINLVNDSKSVSKDKLYNLLKNSKLVSNVKEENTEKYYMEIRSIDVVLNTIEDLQKIIDKVNEEALAQSDIDYLVKIAKQGTDNQFKNALLSLNLDGVNSSWMDSYKQKIEALYGTSFATLTNVKNAIKSVNILELGKISIVNDKGRLEENKIINAIELVQEYYIIDTDNKTEVKAKEDLLNKYNVDLAVANVNNADTQTSLKAALLNLEKVLNDKTKFEYAKSVNEDILSYYVKANDGVAISYQDIVGETSVLVKGYNNALTDAINKIWEKANNVILGDQNNNLTETQKSDLLNAYANLAKVTAKSDTKFDNSKIKAELVVEYAEKARKTDSVATINAYVKSVNEAVVENVLNKIDNVEGKFTLLDALKELGVKNLVDTNEEKYEIEYTDANLKASEWTMTKLQNKVDSTNSLVKLLDSKDVNVVKNELTNIALKDASISNFVNKKDLEKQDIAEVLIKLIADKEVNITKLGQLNEGVSSAETKLEQYIDAFNTTTDKDKLTISATKAALENISAEYKALDGVKKVTIAEKFNSNRKTEKVNNVVNLVKLNNLTEIRTLLAECMK